MKSVLVTGSLGFIGKNLCSRLDWEKDIELLSYDKDNTPEELAEMVKKADFIFHLAGVNRPKNEDDFDKGNRLFTEQIISLVKASQKKTPLLVTSSIQAELDNPYGKSKRQAEKAVFGWAEETGNKIYVYRLPNVFGKWSRPNYNTVIATFCNNIAKGLDIAISDPAAELNLVYIDDVIGSFLECLRAEKTPASDGFCYVDRTFKTTIGDVADRLYAFKSSRDSLLVPDFGDDFNRFLYATYTSYLDEDSLDYNLEMRHDNRGWLAEFIKSKQFGQVFISRTKPGITRGNHWHHTKIEKFLVIDGEAEIRFRGSESTKITSYKVSGNELKVLDIPAGYTHSITNIGEKDLLTLFWADEIFDPNRPDTYSSEV